MSDEKRRYEKRARAASEEATRQRVIDAAIDLHGTVGPARTTISAIAERAGVRRATVYRHFPDERTLFMSCSSAWADRHVLPDPSSWAGLEDALDALYAWYEEAAPMLTAVLRDVDAVPMVAEIQARRRQYLAAVEDRLVAGLEDTPRLRAAVALALDFYTWRTLTGRGLSRSDAVAVMSNAVQRAR
jgi:AcrR family transcriptional regulator